MKMNKQKTLSDFEAHEENPFASQALVKIGQALRRRKVLGINKDEAAILKAIDEKTGEVLGDTAFIRNKTVDDEQFAKFFFAGFKAFFDLRPATIKVFGYILRQLHPNCDYFMFFVDQCRQETGCGVTTIYRALTELCAAEIIARGRNDILYYINPIIVFNGDRVTFATTYIRTKYGDNDCRASNLKGSIQALQDKGDLPRLPLMDD